nr:IS1380 family transposase [Puniceicoccus vermicola]
MLTAYLRPSDRDAALHSAAILKLLVARVRRQWPQVRIIFRGDSGFCRERTLAWCDRNGVDYVVGLARNEVLLREIAPLMERARQEHEKTGQKQRLFGGYIYGAKTWTLKRHVIAKAEHSDKGANHRFVVTSLEGNEQDIYQKIYCARGEMENRIKEQMTLFSERTSAGHWWANQWRLILSAYAYTLWECVRRIGLEGTKFVRAQCATLRLKFLKIGAVIDNGVRVLRLQLPSAFPLKDHFVQALARLRPT